MYFGHAKSYGSKSTIPPFQGCLRGLKIGSDSVSLNDFNIWSRGLYIYGL